MRAHGSKAHTAPFQFGPSYTELNRGIIELRYRLLPYIYTMAWENHNTGMPLVRPCSSKTRRMHASEQTTPPTYLETVCSLHR